MTQYYHPSAHCINQAHVYTHTHTKTHICTCTDTTHTHIPHTHTTHTHHTHHTHTHHTHHTHTHTIHTHTTHTAHTYTHTHTCARTCTGEAERAHSEVKAKSVASCWKENAAAASRTSSDYADNAEFDELIAALKTGAYFEAYARQRGRCGSGVVASPRNSKLLEFRRERLPSGEDPAIPLVPLHEPY